jgi:hypothetical protein
LFGRASFRFYDSHDNASSFQSIRAGFGYEVQIINAAVSICPGALVGYSFGLEVDPDLTAVELIYVIAASLRTELSPTMSAAPFYQLALVYTRVTLDGGPFGEEAEYDTQHALVFGLGLIYNDLFSIVPSVSIPLGQANGGTRFGAAFAVVIGRD